MNSPPQRRDSGLSFLGKAGKRLSFKKEAEQPPPPPKPVLKEAYFPTYQFNWERLKAYLERKFPDVQFGDRNVSLSTTGTQPLRPPALSDCFNADTTFAGECGQIRFCNTHRR